MHEKLLVFKNFLCKSQQLQILCFIIISFIFIFFRWYKLDTSLLFFNDMGRDAVVLLNWAETGKPPLLGPQTSVVSYNQSAWYFYFLFPFFYLTKYWAFSSTLTLTFVALLIYTFLSYLTRKNHHLFFSVSFCMFFLSIQPQVVLQNRFIWNPSFVPYFLLPSLVALIQLRKEVSNLWLAIFCTGIAFAVGFSYSSIPLVFLLIVYLAVTQRKYWMKIFGFCSAAAALVLLPLIAFEIRHNFALTRLFITGQTTPQDQINYSIKSTLLRTFLFPNLSSSIVAILLTVFMAIIVGQLFIFYKQGKKEKTTLLLIFSVLFIFLLSSVYLLPVNIEKHYIFPLLTLGIFLLTLLQKKLAVILGVILCVHWLNPINTFNSATFQPAVRSVAEMEKCYREFCSGYTNPSYISMESGILAGYHNAPEHQFFLRKAGCHILDIESSQDQAKAMLVIQDKGHFDPGNTGYRELSLFGPYVLGQTKKCTNVLSIQEITKPSLSNEREKIFKPQ